MGDERRLAMHADAMHNRGITLVDEAFGDLPGLLGDLAKAHARSDNGDIVLHLVI